MSPHRRVLPSFNCSILLRHRDEVEAEFSCRAGRSCQDDQQGAEDRINDLAKWSREQTVSMFQSVGLIESIWSSQECRSSFVLLWVSCFCLSEIKAEEGKKPQSLGLRIPWGSKITRAERLHGNRKFLTAKCLVHFLNLIR